jgi:hypothetical protein
MARLRGQVDEPTETEPVKTGAEDVAVKQPEPQPQEPVQQQPQPRTVEEAIASTDLPDLAKELSPITHPACTKPRSISRVANNSHKGISTSLKRFLGCDRILSRKITSHHRARTALCHRPRLGKRHHSHSHSDHNNPFPSNTGALRRVRL